MIACAAQQAKAKLSTSESEAFSKRKRSFQQALVLMLLIFFVQTVSAVQPFGANITIINSTTSTPDAPAVVQAQAGNVTEINIEGFTSTQSWQGYFGNVTGAIQLADGSDNIMYNWSLASPEGEIYASTSNTINWANTQCLNYNSDGTYAAEAGAGGTTSQHGTNLSQLELLFNIDFDDVDGVNETFNLIGVGTHNQFYTNNLEFSEGECQSTRLFSSIGAGENDKFEEVLLYEPVSQAVIFTSLLDEDVLGFDGRTHDFEMLVAEDGHGTDTSTTPYYFYVELE